MRTAFETVLLDLEVGPAELVRAGDAGVLTYGSFVLLVSIVLPGPA